MWRGDQPRAFLSNKKRYLCVFYFQYQEELQAEMDRWLEEKEHEMQDILSKKKEVGIKM